MRNMLPMCQIPMSCNNTQQHMRHSDAADSSSSCSLEKRLRRNSMNDSVKGSALRGHDEEYDDCAFQAHNTNSRTSQRRKSLPLRHPQISHLSSETTVISWRSQQFGTVDESFAEELVKKSNGWRSVNNIHKKH